MTLARRVRRRDRVLCLQVLRHRCKRLGGGGLRWGQRSLFGGWVDALSVGEIDRNGLPVSAPCRAGPVCSVVIGSGVSRGLWNVGHLLSLAFVRGHVFEVVARIVTHRGELACGLDCGGLLGLRGLIILDALDIGFVLAPVKVPAWYGG
jgi:hypothetical protein